MEDLICEKNCFQSGPHILPFSGVFFLESRQFKHAVTFEVAGKIKKDWRFGVILISNISTAVHTSEPSIWIMKAKLAKLQTPCRTDRPPCNSNLTLMTDGRNDRLPWQLHTPVPKQRSPRTRWLTQTEIQPWTSPRRNVVKFHFGVWVGHASTRPHAECFSLQSRGDRQTRCLSRGILAG